MAPTLADQPDVLARQTPGKVAFAPPSLTRRASQVSDIGLTPCRSGVGFGVGDAGSGDRSNPHSGECGYESLSDRMTTRSPQFVGETCTFAPRICLILAWIDIRWARL